MLNTTYIHRNLRYFFTKSEAIDIEIGRGVNYPINYSLDILEQINNLLANINTSPQSGVISRVKILQSTLSLFSHLVSLEATGLFGQQQGKRQQWIINPEKYLRFYESDGLNCCIFALKYYIQFLTSNTNKITIIDQMIIKTLFNLIYVTIYSYWHVNCTLGISKQQSYANLKSELERFQFDTFLIRMVTLTLQAYYLPIKKLVMLYTRVLAIYFYTTSNSSNSNNSDDLYEDSEMLEASLNNLLPQNFFQNFKEKNKAQDIKSRSKISPVQAFYSKNNVGDCPLAQSIVVGLLRSLLTICNSQTHKKFVVNPPKNSGADSYRQWQITYQFLTQHFNILKQSKDYKQLLSERSTKWMKDYAHYNQLAMDSNDKQISQTLLTLPSHMQFYKHKIYTTSSISNFFTFLLINFKKNTMIQFTYLYQLVSDANGVLVFLKFLTDKFQSLQTSQKQELSSSTNSHKQNERKYSVVCTQLSVPISFKDEVMLTVYSVLLVLYGACNNYAQKTRSYLFEYNSYLIIKKIPHIFMKGHKNDDQLPSEQEIEAQFGLKQTKIRESDNSNNSLKRKVKQLTQLCYSLLKIQIPFFSKKMKENSNNMKMIIEIYCQMPKRVEPIKRTELDKLILKNKTRKIQVQKYILSIEELKTLHNEYNNFYYWSNEEAKVNQDNKKCQQIIQKPLQMSKDEIEKWLQQNVWRFYD